MRSIAAHLRSGIAIHNSCTVLSINRHVVSCLSANQSYIQAQSLTQQNRYFTTSESDMQDAKRRKVTLIRGHGIGPETTNSLMQVFAALKAPIDWEVFNALEPTAEPNNKERFSRELLESISRNSFVVKGPLFTPQISGYVSPDVTLARKFDLFAHVVPVKTIPSVKTRHSNVDLVIIRENTEGEYSGLEHMVNAGVVQSLKVITRQASRKIAEYAFKYALTNKRRKVTAVHKANIMKMADGLFLKCCREVAGLYHGEVEYEEVIIDNCCMQLVSKPEQFDVMVTGNLYGNIISEAAAGLAGGVGLIPGVNVGSQVRVYEQGCRHLGSDIANTNTANPIAMLESGVMLLRDMQLEPFADNLANAIQKTLADENKAVLTPDLEGHGSTNSITQSIIRHLDPPLK